MIDIDQVQEYLDLIYKASMLSRSALATTNMNPSSSASRRTSRKHSECSMNGITQGLAAA